MKTFIKLIILILFIIIGLSSCSTQKKSADSYPFYKPHTVKNKLHFHDNNRVLSSKPKELSKNNKKVKREIKEETENIEGLYLDVITIKMDETTLMASSQPGVTFIDENNRKKMNEMDTTKNFEVNRIEIDTSTNFVKEPYSEPQDTVSTREVTEQRNDTEIAREQKSKRRTAIIIGASLLLMALLAGISFTAIGSLGANIGVIGVFVLDLLVSFGIYKYHKKERPKLAKTSGILRLIYSAFLGTGIPFLFTGNLSMFNKIWGVGLIVFGLHLITLGILYNNEGGKKWVNIAIKSLLIIAGIGYLIQYVGILLVPNPLGFAALIETIFILPMILCEISYALWMLIKGGKS